MYQLISRSVKTMPMNGEIVPVLVWHARLTPGSYDIVIDANRNGDYNAATDGRDSGSPGFVVVAGSPPVPVPVLTPPGIIGLIGLLCVIGVSKIGRGFN